MEREEFIAICNKHLKLVRIEFGFSQARMADAIGLSKKTLVEIEKERRSLGWSHSITLCTVFADSEILAGTFGGKATDIILALAFEGERPRHPQTMGGRVWWTEIASNARFKIQQNIVFQHYRLLDLDNRRVMSSFNLNDLIPVFDSGNKSAEEESAGERES